MLLVIRDFRREPFFFRLLAYWALPLELVFELVVRAERYEIRLRANSLSERGRPAEDLGTKMD